MGLSDPALFDLIEQKLEQDFKGSQEDRLTRNKVARYFRELGYSGQEKYLPTLQKYVDEPTYKKYVGEAIKNIPVYKKWNPIISNRATFDPTHSDVVNRVANMLRADDLELNALGAKRIYFDLFNNAYLADLLAQKVKANYMVERGVPGDTAQAVAWMVKGLGATRDEKYHDLIRTIATSGTHPTVIRHARSALERDYERSPAPQTGDHTGETIDITKQ
jgi:hypothetical protein